MPSIPIVDLGELGLAGSRGEPNEEEWQRVSKEIRSAFSNIGFVYLINHGIPQEIIDDVFREAESFFSLDTATKRNYKRGATTIQGYTGPDQERLSDIQGIHELRESFDVHTPDGTFPDAEVGDLRPTTKALFDQCCTLTFRLLSSLAIALGLERSFFMKHHKGLTGKDNASCMRLLYYPSQQDDDESVTRCGAHTDYGTITLLFQDSTGGLEVKERGGSWVSAVPIPGSILVNAGDILQFWSADKFKATEHRVLLKGSKAGARQSVVFFVHPDANVTVDPIDGSDKYTPVVAGVHVMKRFTDTYKITE